MNHLSKRMLLVLLVFFMITVQAGKKSADKAGVGGLFKGKLHHSWDWRAVKKLNALHAWFPGTYPLNERKTVEKIGMKVVEKLKAWGCDVPPFQIPDCCLERSIFGDDIKLPLGAEERRAIHPQIQLAFTVVCKWFPAYLVLKSVLKRVVRRGNKESTEHETARG